MTLINIAIIIITSASVIILLNRRDKKKKELLLKDLNNIRQGLTNLETIQKGFIKNLNAKKHDLEKGKAKKRL